MWDEPRSQPRRNPEMVGRHLVFVEMNKLKKRGLIQDWAVYGAVAYMFHEEPIYTQDTDIMVLAEDDKEYARVWSALSSTFHQVPGTMDFEIHGQFVQVFPTSIHPLYLDALKNAVDAKSGEENVKVLSREHLLLMALMAYRPKDQARVGPLMERADRGKVDSLLRRFDSDGKLQGRLQRITGAD